MWANLLANAYKFSAKKETPAIEVGADRQDGFWRFRVSDNGIGIDPEYAERIFVLFQRLHSKDTYAGAGIGLALCKKIVDAHHGRIWVQSEPGAGATFHWIVPLAIPATAR